MPVDTDKIKDALDAFAKDDYVTAKEILKNEIQAAKNSYLKDTVGLEKDTGDENLDEASGDLSWVELTSSSDLKTEGRLMFNCVDVFASDVKAGRIKIFSLRTASGKPVVTALVKDGKVGMAVGKANTPVKPEYRDYIEQLGGEKEE